MGNETILYEVVLTGEWQIDDKGYIWKKRGTEWVRAEHRTPQGYLQVRKMSNGIRLHTGAHRLVWVHFFGAIPEGLTINHKNGIKADNRPDNLEVMTYSENLKHAFRMGLKDQWGQRNPAAKLTNAQVEQIRERYMQGGTTQQELADEFGIAYQTISDIVRGSRREKEAGPIGDYTNRRQRTGATRNKKGQYIS